MNSLSKIFFLLSRKEKNHFFLLLALVLFMALFDVLGIASILPFVMLLMSPNLVETNIFLKNIYQISNFFGVSNINDFIFFFGVIVFFLLLTSILIRGITQFLLIRFALMREFSIGKLIFKNYLSEPYVWFLDRQTSDLTKNILSEVNVIIDGTLMPMLNLIAQTIVVISLLVLLFITDPKLAILIFLIFGISYVLVFFFVRNSLSRMGTERLISNSQRFNIIKEAFGSSKEVKIRDLEEMYLNQFEKPAKNFAHNQSTSTIIALIPRYFIEGIAFGGIVLMILFFLSNGGRIELILPSISLFVFAGYRMMPSLQQVYLALAQLRFSNASLDLIYEYLRNKNINYDIKETKILDNIEFKNSLSLKNICYSYPNSEKKILVNISLKIPAFSKIGIVGSTGSGKTTLVDILIGLLEPTAGKLLIDGQEISVFSQKVWRKKIGYIPQQIFLNDSSIASNIAYGVNKEDIDYDAVKNSINLSGMEEFIFQELPENYNTIVGENGVKLSGGQRQRIGIARAIYHNPELLILDEATSSLDNLTEEFVMNSIVNKMGKKTIIIVAHRLSTIKQCDKIFFLNNGKLEQEGTYQNLFENNENFRKMTLVKNNK